VASLLESQEDVPAHCLEHIDVAVLAGGLGTRLRKVVLCLGYKAEMVIEYLKELRWEACRVVTVVESKPLGTAGALRLAADELASAPELVMNGDSFVAADLCEYLRAHGTAGAEGSLLGCRVADSSRYGTIEVDRASRITGFREKMRGAGLVSAGVYLLEQRLLERIRKGAASSLERDVFPALPEGSLYCHAVDAEFIDIGTQESYARAPLALRNLIARMAARQST
jgi:NDP-sugar pyrophosphorylase family protein